MSDYVYMLNIRAISNEYIASLDLCVRSRELRSNTFVNSEQQDDWQNASCKKRVAPGGLPFTRVRYC